MRNKLLVLASLVIIASMVLAGCATPTATTAPQPAQPGVTEVVKTVEVTVPGENTVQVVTATPPPAAPPATFKSKDPTTFVYATFGDHGDDGPGPGLRYCLGQDNPEHL